MHQDTKTADSFANSWNNLPLGSIYTQEQFEDWFLPLSKKDIESKNILELGCGNGSLLVHITSWKPESITGVDLGDSIISCTKNMQETGFENFQIIKSDLVTFRSEEKFDLCYCIGVLHHLKDPYKGFESVINNTKSGGHFHCWVYAKEGNALVIYLVEPIRKIAYRLPWWFNKYLVATPLAFIYYLYAHLIVFLNLSIAPLYEYSKWISKRGFLFFRHVAFDQLVTPQTTFIDKKTIEKWVESFNNIDTDSTYIIFRNGNSWKFGGKIT